MDVRMHKVNNLTIEGICGYSLPDYLTYSSLQTYQTSIRPSGCFYSPATFRQPSLPRQSPAMLVLTNRDL